MDTPLAAKPVSNSGVIAEPPAPQAPDEKKLVHLDCNDDLKSCKLHSTVTSTILSSTPATSDPSFVTWDSPDDPENPQNWSSSYKWFLTILSAFITTNVSFDASAPTTVTHGISSTFNVSPEVTNLITSLFLLGYVAGPLFWGPGSEFLGRRPIYILTLSAYTLFHLGQTLAMNIQTLLITRFFSGFFGVAPLVLGGGFLADLWSTEQRGPPTSIWIASVFFGPAMGPLVSGFIAASSLSWRWVFWVMMIFSGFCTLCAVFLLSETYHPVILTYKAQRLRKQDPIANGDLRAEHEGGWSLKELVNRTIYRPLCMLALEPILVLITIYLSVVYGILFALFESFPIIFGQTHNLTTSQTGLMFLGVGIGSIVGGLIYCLSCRGYPRLTKQWHGFPPPEYRLYGSMIGGPLLAIACFWLGWTGQYKSVPWYVPGISTVFIGIGITTIFASLMSYMIDTYLEYSASAFAGSTIVRSAFSAAFPLFTVQMYRNLGINWASTLIGIIASILAPIPILFYWFGSRIRARSKFAPCKDLHIAEHSRLENQDLEKK